MSSPETNFLCMFLSFVPWSAQNAVSQTQTLLSSLLYFSFVRFYDSAAVNQYGRIEDISKKLESTMHGTGLLDKIFSGLLIFVKIYEGEINQKIKQL